jgi:hypothetical protein
LERRALEAGNDANEDAVIPSGNPL